MFAFNEDIDREALKAAFEAAGLDCNFRWCGVPSWHMVATECIGIRDESLVELFWWQDHPPEKIARWLETARERAEHVRSLGLEPDRFIRFLEVCVALGAGVYVS